MQTTPVVLHPDVLVNSVRGEALAVLRTLKQEMELGGLTVGTKTKVLGNGWTVKCSSCYGIDTVDVTVPSVDIVTGITEVKQYPVFLELFCESISDMVCAERQNLSMYIDSVSAPSYVENLILEVYVEGVSDSSVIETRKISSLLESVSSAFVTERQIAFGVVGCVSDPLQAIEQLKTVFPTFESVSSVDGKYSQLKSIIGSYDCISNTLWSVKLKHKHEGKLGTVASLLSGKPKKKKVIYPLFGSVSKHSSTSRKELSELLLVGSVSSFTVIADKTKVITNTLLECISGINSPTTLILNHVLTITIHSVSKTYGNPDPAFTYTAVGLVEGDVITGEVGRQAGENAGTYTLSIGTLSFASYYKVTVINGTLTILKQIVLLNWYPTALTAEYTGSPISMLSESNYHVSVTVNGGSPILVEPHGSFTVGTQIGDYNLTGIVQETNYYSIQVSAVFKITKGTAQIIAADQTVYYRGQQVFASAVTVPANIPVIFTYNGSLTAPINAGVYTVTGTIDDVHYKATTVTWFLTIKKSMVGLAWSQPAAITYGTVLSATQLNATATVPGVFTYTPPVGTLLSAGSSILMASFAPTDSTNYDVPDNITVSIIVNKASQTPEAYSYPVEIALDEFATIVITKNGEAGTNPQYMANTNGLVSISGNTFKGIAVGSLFIIVFFPGNTNYNGKTLFFPLTVKKKKITYAFYNWGGWVNNRVRFLNSPSGYYSITQVGTLNGISITVDSVNLDTANKIGMTVNSVLATRCFQGNGYFKVSEREDPDNYINLQFATWFPLITNLSPILGPCTGTSPTTPIAPPTNPVTGYMWYWVRENICGLVFAFEQYTAYVKVYANPTNIGTINITRWSDAELEWTATSIYSGGKVFKIFSAYGWPEFDSSHNLPWFNTLFGTTFTPLDLGWFGNYLADYVHIVDVFEYK